MFELLALGVLLVGGLLLLGLVGAVLNVVFWLILLPFRLLFKLLVLPFLLVGFVLKLALGVLLLPVVGVVAVIGVIGLVVAGVFAVLLPLLPVVLVGAAIVALVKYLGRPAAVAPPIPHA